MTLAAAHSPCSTAREAEKVSPDTKPMGSPNFICRTTMSPMAVNTAVRLPGGAVPTAVLSPISSSGTQYGVTEPYRNPSSGAEAQDMWLPSGVMVASMPTGFTVGTPSVVRQASLKNARRSFKHPPDACSTS